MNYTNFKHPEHIEGEIFLKNMTFKNFNKLVFSTKRMGKQSYDGIGNKLTTSNWFPVFIKATELKSNKYTLSQIRHKLIS